MFSVPESIEIRAPADRANHSTGTPHLLGEVEGGDDARALGSATAPSALVGSPQQHAPG